MVDEVFSAETRLENIANTYSSIHICSTRAVVVSGEDGCSEVKVAKQAQKADVFAGYNA